MRTFRVFLSSPGDVVEERHAARELLEKLPRGPLLRGRVSLDVVSWDDPDAPAPMLANLSPQDAVNRGLPTPAMCDLTVVILWGWMGTPLALPGREGGTGYRSGTEWEYENARAAGKDILLYRRASRVLVDIDDPEFDDKRRQKQLVEDFFLQFKAADGSLLGGFASYQTVDEFVSRLRQDVESILVKFLNDATSVEPSESAPGARDDAARVEPRTEAEKWREAERLWRIDADTGNPRAMINVGMIVEKRDPDEAASWFKKAADLGDRDGLYLLGMLFKDRDPLQGEHWLRQSAEAGDLSGMAQLAQLLRVRDPRESEEWFRKAATGGVEYAMTDLGLLLLDRDPKEAEVWLHRAANAHDARGMFSYGLLLEKRDPAAAESWFRKAAAAGNSEARLRVLDLD